jgi:hypothetical protein
MTINKSAADIISAVNFRTKLIILEGMSISAYVRIGINSFCMTLLIILEAMSMSMLRNQLFV